MRESRRRIEDTTEPKKEEKKDGKQILCFITKTAHIEQSLFDPIGPFSYVLSHIETLVMVDNYIILLLTVCVKILIDRNYIFNI